MASLYINPDGTTVNVSGAEAIARYDASPLHSLAPDVVVSAYPEGDVGPEWTVKQLTAWAAEHDVDLGEATKKADILELVAAAVKPAEPADPAGPPQS